MENPYAAPQAEILTPRGTQAPLTWKQILFSIEGRIPRRTFWGFSILVGIAGALAMAGLAIAIGGDVGNVAALALYIPLLWIHVAIQGKRWHDRDRSAWFVLVSLIPIVGGIWTLIECGCLRGTEGPNTYGEDPT